MWGGVLQRVLEHKSNGLINCLGVSIQSPEELVTALSYKSIEFIQMPLNIIDWRWIGMQKKIIQEKEKRNLVIHVRSALLQGLLSSIDENLWCRAHLVNPETILNWLKKMAQVNACSDVADLCFRYVRSKSWVDGVVVGMESQEQMLKNIAYFSGPVINLEQLKEIELTRPLVSINTLDPSMWL